MKKVSLLLGLALTTITATAQTNLEQTSGISKEAGHKTTFVNNSATSNWFVGASVGTNMYFGSGDAQAKFFKRPSISGHIQVGKWFNPYVGGRFKATVGRIHTFSQDASVMNRQNAYMGEFDIMFNMMNYFGKYNEKRVYSLIPYVGIGGAYGRGYSIKRADGKHHQKSFTLNTGLINQFRFSSRVAMEVEFSAAFLKDNFDRRENRSFSYDLIGNASVGFVFNIGANHNFKEAVLADIDEMNRLNNNINNLRAENEELRNRPMPVVEKEVETKVETKVVEVVRLANSPVYFSIGSSKIEKNQEMAIYNIAQHMKEHPEAKINVVGYADKSTGSAAFNEKISEKRTAAVVDALVNQYNISRSRISVSWKGDAAQVYNVNDTWNRVVMVTEKK